jgi:hypothetical protein
MDPICNFVLSQLPAGSDTPEMRLRIMVLVHQFQEPATRIHQILETLSSATRAEQV